ncbi:MAG: hypothetical protein AAFO91_03890, partial [Bacteroidota bacterium]
MDSFIYSPAISGLSVSYLGDGGWNTSNHTSDAARVAANAGQKNQYYTDEACVAHLNMVAWKDKAQTTLRDNIFILLEIQNGAASSPAGHDGQMREDLLAILTRWNNAADVVDPSGTLKSQLKLIVMSMADHPQNNQHDRLAAMMPDIAGLGGYAQVEFIDMYNAIKTIDGGIYADFRDYTAVGTGNTGFEGNGSIQPSWYSVDTVHPTEEGGLQQMRIFWDVVKNAAADPTAFSFSINAPSGGTTDDTYNYTLSGSLPADRLVTWYVDDVETAYGDAFTLPAVEGTFVVKATVNGLDGASATVTAPAVSIVSPNDSPAFTIQPRLEDDEEPIIEGGLVVLEFRATDADGGTLEYFVDGQSIGTFIQNTTVTANVTAGSAGVLQTVNVTVSDGVAPAVSATPLTFTPASANTAPSIGTFSTGTGPFTEGDTVSLAASSIADAENDTLTYVITLTIDGASQPGTVASGTVPANGVVAATNVAATAGSYVYTLTVTDPDGASDTETASTTVAAAPTGPTTEFAITQTYSGSGRNYSASAVLGENNPADAIPELAASSNQYGLFAGLIRGGASARGLDVSAMGANATFHTAYRSFLENDIDHIEFEMISGPNTGDKFYWNSAQASIPAVSGSFFGLGPAGWSLND